MSHRRIRSDFLVIGSGLAGLSFARKASTLGDVIILSKSDYKEGSTSLAQGGVAISLGSKDDREAHIADTLRVGDGLSKPDIVRKVVEFGPRVADELIELGVPFDRDKETHQLLPTREGGHSVSRVLHVADSTGQAIESAELDSIFTFPNIRILEHHTALDILTQHHIPGYTMRPGESIRCFGAYVLDNRSGEVITVEARIVVLATGGAGQIYQHTTNPSVSTGDGVAMAYRAGATVLNMEFVQFHPTMLYDSSGESSFLITEAVRGEGGILRRSDGYRFMKDYAPDEMELAPRDIVARAIDQELKKSGDKCVYLDITHKGAYFVRSRFPMIYETCIKKGIDIAKEWIPVVPAAHYTCGGIKVDENGRTDIENLYAIGEVSCTGLHGANRLASNSLLEAAAFAHFAYEDIKSRYPIGGDSPAIPDWDDSGIFDSKEWVIVSHNRDELRRLMWDYVGIMRSDMRLTLALGRVSLIWDEVDQFYRRNPVRRDVVELRNMVYVGQQVIRSALARKESRGLHYNKNYPSKSDGYLKDTELRSSSIYRETHIGNGQ